MGKKTVQGNLTGDPRQVQTKAGQKLVVFKMAENHRKYDEADQQWKDAEPTFYDVAVDRERLAANVLNSVHKGDRVTVAGNYQVDAYATSTGEPGLNHRIWAEDVAASLQHNQVEIIPRDRSRDDPDRWLGQTGDQGVQGVQASAPAASSAQTASSGVSHVDPGTAPGVRPEQVTPEAYAAWSAQQGSMYAQAQRQGVSGPTR
ncbi:single-stranded DNA-binding protein [Citricoccus zhacaiensis]